MVSSKEESLVYNIRLSSVGPAKVIGQDSCYEPTNIDLAMKLHYLRGVYYFQKEAFEGLSIMNIKEPAFSWLNDYYITCGRLRRNDLGRPYIKCNDCGVRFIEAQCDKTLDEWLEVKDASLEKLLVSSQVLGPELQFSPPVLMQLTKFRCGGVALGLSFAHVLGDTFTATQYINAFGKFMAGEKPKLPINLAQSNITTTPTKGPEKPTKDPLSLKRVGPVEDHWITPTNTKMEPFSFHITSTQLDHLQLKLSGKGSNALGPFETICAVIWQSIAQIREENGPKVVTICKKDPENKMDMLLSNSNQTVSVLQADFSILEAHPRELAMLIKTSAVDERKKIEEAIERENGVADFIVYGANLTFLNLDGADLYGLDIRGHKPVLVNYFIDGVSDEGVVLVLPGPKSGENDHGNDGRIVTLILPEKEIVEVKSELQKNGLMC